MIGFYPTLVSDKLVETVNFYEDFFGFVPAIEKEGYAFLQNKDKPDICLAVFDAAHECVERLKESVSGLILSFPVKDVKGMYDRLYMEGLELYKDMGEDINGKQHFVVYDPNGILINVHESMAVSLKAAA